MSIYKQKYAIRHFIGSFAGSEKSLQMKTTLRR